MPHYYSLAKESAVGELASLAHNQRTKTAQSHLDKWAQSCKDWRFISELEFFRTFDCPQEHFVDVKILCAAMTKMKSGIINLMPWNRYRAASCAMTIGISHQLLLHMRYESLAARLGPNRFDYAFYLFSCPFKTINEQWRSNCAITVIATVTKLYCFHELSQIKTQLNLCADRKACDT